MVEKEKQRGKQRGEQRETIKTQEKIANNINDDLYMQLQAIYHNNEVTIVYYLSINK